MCIQEAWLFDESSPDLFNSYIKNYAILKYKSGFPNNIRTNDEKNLFLKKLSEGMGIELKQEDVVENPAMRSLAKAYLVNLWGYVSE